MRTTSGKKPTKVGNSRRLGVHLRARWKTNGNVVRIRGRIDLECLRQMHLLWEIRRPLVVDPQPCLAVTKPDNALCTIDFAAGNYAEKELHSSGIGQNLFLRIVNSMSVKRSNPAWWLCVPKMFGKGVSGYTERTIVSYHQI